MKFLTLTTTVAVLLGGQVLAETKAPAKKGEGIILFEETETIFHDPKAGDSGKETEPQKLEPKKENGIVLYEETETI